MMSQNCKTTYTAATTRDANNNTLYHGGAQGCGRGYGPPTMGTNGNFQQMTAKVLFGSVTSINELKLQEKAEREVRRTH
ncbi:uncharacterized protein LOC134791325 [Cydia splendana]|uniref:uncharacterized protein LOC134791325 n=1 Tax=Cydia splendana TaxID=1100963 RepID=UPI00213D1219